MTDTRVWKLPDSAPDPAELAAAWSRVVENGLAALQAGTRAGSSMAYDPTAPARAMFEFQAQLWTNPMSVLQAGQAAPPSGTPQAALIVGNVVNFGAGEPTTTRYDHPRHDERLRWLWENPIHQPGTFWTADLTRRFGPFDESLRYTFDFDFFARLRF